MTPKMKIIPKQKIIKKCRQPRNEDDPKNEDIPKKCRKANQAACREKIQQSGICPAPCVLRQWTSLLTSLQYKCEVLHQSSLHENVFFSVCARMGNAAYITFIMRNSISSLDTREHFRFNISCPVSVEVSSKILFFRGRLSFKGHFHF